MNARMFELAQKQKGYLGIESARGRNQSSVTYWETLEDIANGEITPEHKLAQEKRLFDLVSGVCDAHLRVERDNITRKIYEHHNGNGYRPN
jgi:heme-degrading monooxygenase HmoA